MVLGVNDSLKKKKKNTRIARNPRNQLYYVKGWGDGEARGHTDKNRSRETVVSCISERGSGVFRGQTCAESAVKLPRIRDGRRSRARCWSTLCPTSRWRGYIQGVERSAESDGHRTHQVPVIVHKLTSPGQFLWCGFTGVSLKTMPYKGNTNGPRYLTYFNHFESGETYRGGQTQRPFSQSFVGKTGYDGWFFVNYPS